MQSPNLTLTWRGFYRRKLYHLTNIGGLGVALACSLTLLLYCLQEFYVDRHHVKADRIVRLVNEFTSNGEARGANATTSRSLGPLLIKQYPQIGEFVRVQFTARSLVRFGDTQNYRADMIVTDPNVFNVFSHDVLLGDPDTALNAPDGIAISDSFAKYYFGENYLSQGKTLGATLLINDLPYRVTLVFADIGNKSHLRYNALLPMSSAMNSTGINVDNASPSQLFSIGVYTYLLLDDNFPRSHLQALLDEFYRDVMAKIGDERNLSVKFWWQPLTEIYFGRGYSREIPNGTGNGYYVMGLLAIASILILVAGINYGNQATVLALRQSESIQLRQLLGASPWRLSLQNLLEAQFSVFAALIVALLLTEIVRWWGVPLQPLNLAVVEQLIQHPSWLLMTLLLTACIGFSATFYPTLFLLRLSTNRHFDKKRPRLVLRHVLVFCQFLVVTLVITCTLIVNRQIQYIVNYPMGYDSQALLAINLKGADVASKATQIKTRLLEHPDILGVSTSGFVPPGNVPTNQFAVENNEGSFSNTAFDWMMGGEDFAEVMGFELIEGAGFPTEFNPFVERPVLVNQNLVKAMQWDQALGKRLRLGDFIDGRVVGVIENFHYQSLHTDIQALVVAMQGPLDYSGLSREQRNNVTQPLLIKIDPRNRQQSIQHLETTMNQFAPDQPFEYWLFEESINSEYWLERNLMRLITVFSIICIAVALVGLISLISHSIEQRNKEVGIRKVLGAGLITLLQLLSSSTFALILGASVVAVGLSYFVTQSWLQTFVYQAPFSPLTYLAAVVLVTAVAGLVIVYQCLRAAQWNPVDLLRTE